MRKSARLKVVLHIGGAKCGSSAIQAYLKLNAQALAARGIGVPGTALDFHSDVTGEQIWFFEDANVSEDLGGLTKRFKTLVRSARSRRLETLIVSAENICNHPHLAAACSEALADADVQVVFYVRRQDDFLISSWQQWNLKRYAALDDFLEARVGKDANWLRLIDPWADAFGDECISVRPFLRDQLKNRDVVDDFFDTIGLAQTGLQPLPGKENPSFDEALARLAHGVRDVFDGPHDNRFYDVMAQLLGDVAFKKGSASSLLPLERRKEILAVYSEENAVLADRFLPDYPSETLFPPPTEANVTVLSAAEKTQQEIALLTRAVYALAARQQGLNL